MKEKHRTGFLNTDLHRYFERYCIEKFVRRFLRTHEIDTVGDLVGLEKADFEAFLDKESASQKVRERSLYLYGKLRESLDKIIAAGTPKKQPVKTGVEALQPAQQTETEDVKDESLVEAKPEELILRAQPSQPGLGFPSPADSISSPTVSEPEVDQPKSKQPSDMIESPTAKE